MSAPIELTCPCCRTKLVIDRTTGVLLSEEREKPDTEATFEKAMDDVRSGGRRREDAFSKAFEQTKNLDDILDKKFEEARKKAAKDATPPKNPLDWD